MRRGLPALVRHADEAGALEPFAKNAVPADRPWKLEAMDGTKIWEGVPREPHVDIRLDDSLLLREILLVNDEGEPRTCKYVSLQLEEGTEAEDGPPAVGQVTTRGAWTFGETGRLTLAFHTSRGANARVKIVDRWIGVRYREVGADPLIRLPLSASASSLRVECKLRDDQRTVLLLRALDDSRVRYTLSVPTAGTSTHEGLREGSYSWRLVDSTSEVIRQGSGLVLVAGDTVELKLE